MRKSAVLVFTGIVMAILATGSFAGDEHKGSMKGSEYEHGSLPKADKAGLQDIMKKYITDRADQNGGIFEIAVPVSGQTRKLTFLGLHDDIQVKNGLHYSCADFKDTETGETLDVDIFLDVTGGEVVVSDVVIHKVGDDIVDGSEFEDKGSMKGSGY